MYKNKLYKTLKIKVGNEILKDYQQEKIGFVDRLRNEVELSRNLYVNKGFVNKLRNKILDN